MYGRGAGVAAASGSLAYTGFNGGMALTVALALMAVGGVLLMGASRWRRRVNDTL